MIRSNLEIIRPFFQIHTFLLLTVTFLKKEVYYNLTPNHD